ncbi:DMT family transporter [Tissierella sp. Yu-01]|uniref:DMT family transporter n=1 Tax=Tissierella sp. Yu-01 TaxID=3035694 RepID=UPI00240DD0B6|nr:DMT family transporter [Tissierella sp. Yu-01]WFA07972.1 DMT family transporter [Tissierella sp. Yu-01]
MKSRLYIIIAMLTFGSISIFVRKIGLPSSVISLLRAIIASLFLILYSVITKNKISMQKIKDNFWLLLLSGSAMGANWIFLFEAYKYTTVSNATLTYYFEPAIVMLLSPFLLKEKLSIRKFISIVVAVAGLFMIVNTDSSVVGSYNHPLGLTYGLIAAILYATVILTNKFFKNLSGLEATLIQLVVSVIVLVPYVLFVERPTLDIFKAEFIPYILILGILYTAIPYLLYFTGMQNLKGQTIAMLSYIDPVSAVIISAVVFKESLTLLQVAGGMLILGSSYINDNDLTQFTDGFSVN